LAATYYISTAWVHRFQSFADPGPISNQDFLCVHLGEHLQTGTTGQVCLIFDASTKICILQDKYKD